MRNGVSSSGRFPLRDWTSIALCFLLPVGAAIWAGGAMATETPLEGAIAAGQRIYRDGVLPSGALLRAEARPGVVRTGADAACSACHRRSGFGMAEGPISIPPITGQALFESEPVVAANPRLAHLLGGPLLPPYDEAALTRAIRDGVARGGRILGEGMPRYALSDAECAALITYLRTLGDEQAPGVGDADIHLATVIQPGVSPRKRQEMLDILTAFVRDKNAGTRSDERRRQVGIMRMQRAYRHWHLDVWDLTGPADTWAQQLATLYQKQPVFAIIGGLGSGDWEPIHAFSERFHVPCVFPQTPLPDRDRKRYYTLYLSGGVLLEADVLARYLAGREPRQLVQVYRRDTPGAVAARQLRATLPDAERRLADRVSDGPPDSSFWRQLGAEAGDTEFILWLDATDIGAADALPRSTKAAPTIYLSASLLDGLARAAPLAAAGADTLLVYPWASPAQRDTAQFRTRAWLKRNGLAAAGDDPVQTDTFFAVNIVGDALSHVLDSFSREYFIERVEHVVQQSLVPSSYPHVSLGPDQRFAAKGSYVVRLDPGKGFAAVSDWIVP